ncbi:hypothetical protein SSP24_52670 [Streptomyces spinoverrucosus]|uniref:Uncharacterized protein n=1 Tax=Streptomyces spinoverrucosus TaxID=284043 RepID=A0A4Y3VKR0_9ACTN|nr:hypothetical protein SSP24_52670 [Streptomyces spinoverrucosus]
MTKATRDGIFGLLASQQRGGRFAGHAVTMGPYTYIPAPAHCSASVNGTLTKDGPPVTLRATEPILRHFLDVMAEMEADLARRWIRSQGTSAFPTAK